MDIQVVDYMSCKHQFGFDLENVTRIEIKVVTGDEIVTAMLNDESERTFDPMKEYRRSDFFDYSYVVYDKVLGINNLDADWFKNRSTSYSVINDYPITKDYILKYDLSDGTDAYIELDVLDMLSSNSAG